jgi:hypothetical protein
MQLMLLPDQLAAMRLGIAPEYVPPALPTNRVYGSLFPPPASYSRIETTPRISGDNTKLGDCFPTACVNAVQTFIYRGKAPLVTLDDLLAIETYEDMAGYNPSMPSTDQGTNPDKGFTWWANNAIAGYQLSNVTTIDPTDELAIHNEISRDDGIGSVILLVNLSVEQQNQRVWMPVGVPGSWGPHAVCADSYGGSLIKITSWGEEFYIDRSYLLKSGFVLAVCAMDLRRL